MSGPLIVLILGAIAITGIGLHVLSLHLDRFPTDARRPGPLLFGRRTKPETAHSAELRRLVNLVSFSILNDRSAQAELQQVFDELEAPVSPLGQSTAGRRDRQRRSRLIAQAITDLERRHHLDQGVDQPTGVDQAEPGR